jgi:hypothetical protein
VDVPIAESQINLNWGPIMKTINEDPSEFFAGGGWGFLPIPGQPSDEVRRISIYIKYLTSYYRMAHPSLERSPPIVKTRNLRKAPVRQVKAIMTKTATPVMRTCLVAMNQVKTGMIWKRRLPNVCPFFFR